MPLVKGKSKRVISENISELHSGATHARTAKKFGKKRADKQSVAIAMSEARKAGHNPPKPHHHKERAHEKGAKAGHDHELIAHANHRLPAHMRGKGIISSKAMAIMGKKLAAEATPAVGTHVAKAGKSHAAKPDAKAAKPWKGQKLPGWASPEHGKQDAERAHADRERNRKGPTGKMSYSKRVAHNQPTPNYTQVAMTQSPKRLWVDPQPSRAQSLKEEEKEMEGELNDPRTGGYWDEVGARGRYLPPTTPVKG